MSTIAQMTTTLAGGWDGGPGPWAGGPGPWWPVLPLLWLLLIGGLVAYVLVVARRRDRRAGRRSGERLLAERYASGEIDEDEYQHRLSVLRDKG